MRYATPQEPTPYGQYQPPPRKKSKLPWVLAGIAVLLLLGCGVLTLTALSTDANDGVEFTTPPPSPRPTAKAKPATKPAVEGEGSKALPDEVSEGGYVVGQDLAPGTYRTSGARPEIITLCTWSVHAGGEPDGKIKDVGAIDGEDETADVRLSKGDYFKTTGCERWAKR